MKTQTMIRPGSAQDILKDIDIPEEYVSCLTEEEKALLKFVLGGLNINDLAKIYKQRNRAMKTEIIWKLIQLGQKLTLVSLFESELSPNWTPETQKENAYLKKAYFNGFDACKTQVQRIVTNGLRKHSGR
jgi:hypothetical protein